MRIRKFDCPSCGTSLQIKDGQITLPCPHCGGTVVVPESVTCDDSSGDTQKAAPVQPSVIIDPGRTERSSSGMLLSLVLLVIIVIAAIVSYKVKCSDSREVLEESVSPISEEPVIPVVLEFGGPGSGAGYFQDPLYICLDDQGNIFVGELETGRIQIFDENGNYTSQWNFGDPDFLYLASMAISRDGLIYLEYSLKHGLKIYIHNAYTGELVDSLEHPEGHSFNSFDICDDGSVVAVLDFPQDDIVKFAPDGSIDFILEKALSSVTDETEYYLGVSVDGLGNIFVNSAIFSGYFKFSPEGHLLKRFGYVFVGESPQYINPHCECIDPQGRLWANASGDLVVFGNDGTFLTTIDLDWMFFRDIVMNDGYQLYCLTMDDTIVQLDLSDVVEDL